jgi:hypothetical protein
MARLPKYLIVKWDTSPTEYDSHGCDGMYLRDVKIKWWGWPIVAFSWFYRFVRDYLCYGGRAAQV